jgi:hypothetical protein
MSFLDDIAETIEDDAADTLAAKLGGQTTPNGTLLDQYDMVLAYPLSTINTEISKLVANGTIHSSIVLYRTLNGSGDYQYALAPSSGAIPAGAESIDAQVMPQLQCAASGNDVILVLNFISGNASFADKSGVGPAAKIQQYDMKGWAYGFAVNLAQRAWGNNSGGAAPAAQQILARLMAAQFSLQSVFLDFVSSDLHSSDPGTTTGCPKEMELFMSFYFSNLDAAANPYILGYSVTGGSSGAFATTLPPSLAPSSAGYVVFHDPTNPGASNLNFVMDTQGGFGQFSGQPMIPQSNWFAPGEVASGKLIIGHNCLFETLILQPFYQQLQQTVYTQISGSVSVGQGNSYAAGLQKSDSGWTCTISNANSGDDQYVNTFAVSFQNVNGTAVAQFTGSLNIHKEVSQNNFFCTAHAWASSFMTWTGTVTLSVQNGILECATTFNKTGGGSNSDKNTCADAFSWIGSILGGILDVGTGWADGGFFSGLLASALSVSVPGIGTVQVALGNFLPDLSSMNVLPSGSTLAGTAVAFDPNGNVYVTLA